jgi:hypothetical protein
LSQLRNSGKKVSRVLNKFDRRILIDAATEEVLRIMYDNDRLKTTERNAKDVYTFITEVLEEMLEKDREDERLLAQEVMLKDGAEIWTTNNESTSQQG